MTRRTTVKAIAEGPDGLLLMLTPATGDVKFPGGGVRHGEEHGEALQRELLEETGRQADAVGAPVLTVIERRASREDPAQAFEMTSHYFRVRVGPVLTTPTLDDYEAALGLTPIVMPVAAALQANDRSAAWFRREQAVLRLVASGIV